MEYRTVELFGNCDPLGLNVAFGLHEPENPSGVLQKIIAIKGDCFMSWFLNFSSSLRKVLGACCFACHRRYKEWTGQEQRHFDVSFLYRFSSVQ